MHNVPDWMSSQAGPFDLWPTGLGFEYFYGFLGGDTDQWAPRLFRNTSRAPDLPPGELLDHALARTEGVRPQSMSAVVTTLLEAGLVQGSPDPADGRQTLISLTPKCLKWIREGRAAKQDWLTTTISQKLSSREQEKLRVGLELLARLVEE